MRQDVARLCGAGGVDCHPAFIDVLNDSFFVDHESGPITVSALFIEDSVILDHRPFEIAQERESDPILLAELAVSRNAVDADAENLCVSGFEFGETSLVRLHLLRSTTGKSQHIKGEHDIFFVLKVAQLISH